MSARIDYTIPVADRLLSAIEYDTNGGCWLWAGGCDKALRGHLQVPGEQVLAYRLSYQEFVGPIPDGMFVCHRCDTPPCINPEHLFLGTPAQNVADMVSKNRCSREPVVWGEDHPLSKLTEADVQIIRRLTAFSEKRVASLFKVRPWVIRQVRLSMTWKQSPPRDLTTAEVERAAMLVGQLRAMPPKAKISPDDVAFIRRVYRPRHPEFSSDALAKRFGVTRGAICYHMRSTTRDGEEPNTASPQVAQ